MRFDQFSGISKIDKLTLTLLKSIRWVSEERWHSELRSETLVDDTNTQEIPYSDELEFEGEL